MPERSSAGHAVAPAALHVRARPGAPPRWRVLLVEDNPGDAQLTRELLDQSVTQRFAVRCAPTLAAAEASLSAGDEVDAIILDLNLPDSRGVDTVRRMRRLAQDVPIIALSGQADEELRVLARDEGAEDLFDKQEANSRLLWRGVLQIIDRRSAQQRQFQSLLDAAPDGMVLATQAGRVRYVNQAAVELFGRPRDEILGEPLGFSVIDDQPSEITIPRADGHRDCEMRVVRVDWDDEPVWLASIRDVTDRKRAAALRAHAAELEYEYRRIEASSRFKSEFLANMSHELRTPLNAVIGFSQLLLDGVVAADSPKYPIFLGHILTSGRHLLQLINDSLDLAKIEAGKLAFVPEAVSLRALVEEVTSILAVAAEKKGVRIDVDVDDALADVRLDPGRFKQVLFNYLSNALKFAAERTTVDVRVAAEGDDHFLLEVQDRGRGIAPADLAGLFTAFHQIGGGGGGGAGGERQPAGTGLGLALTKRLVEAQGGSVGVRSTVGEGSVFFAILPRLGQAL